MKKLCALLLTLALCCPIPAAHAADSGVFVDSSFAFTIVVDGGKNNAMAGFVVAMTPDTTYVLTDTMILAGGAPYACATVLFRDGEMNTEKLLPTEVVWTDSTSNIALLAVDTEGMMEIHRAFPALAPMSSVSNGDTLHRIGMDISDANPNWSQIYCVHTSGTAIVSSNYPSGMFSLTTSPYMGDGVLDMGGAVVDEEGVVVGISVYCVIDDELNAEFIIGLDEVMDYLDSQNIPYPTRGYHGAITYEGQPTIVPVDEDGKEGGRETGPSAPPERTGSSGSSGGGLAEDALSGGAVGLVAAGAAGAFLWLKKKKNPGQAGQTTTSAFSGPADPTASGGLALVGVGGQMDGCRFPLQGTGLSFGRDPSRCAVIYDSGTPGVSSLHCQLIPQGGAWSLIDLESSYGTYLNGRRLEPFAAAPLRPGDTFWLGQPQNSFTLKEG